MLDSNIEFVQHALASIEVLGAANAQSALVMQDGLFHHIHLRTFSHIKSL